MICSVVRSVVGVMNLRPFSDFHIITMYQCVFLLQIAQNEGKSISFLQLFQKNFPMLLVVPMVIPMVLSMFCIF